MIESINLSTSEWARIRDNPRQRDTEAHLRKAKHLYSPSPTHKRVAAARLDGKLYKLDGHTRALLWSRSPGLAPVGGVEVDVYPVSNVTELCKLYDEFDSRAAAETVADAAYGAMREIGFDPQSFLKKGGFTLALQIAEGVRLRLSSRRAKSPIHELVREWKPELTLLDGVPGFSAKRFSSVFIAAALVTLRKHPEKALDFWWRYSQDLGKKQNTKKDGVQMADDIRRDTVGRVGGSSSASMVAFCKVLSAFERYRLGQLYENGRGGGARALKSEDYFA